jgi:crossover junction endodeoxyribonuclease RuvC
MTTIILGIDPGTRITGYGVIQSKDGCLTVMDFGCIRPPPKELLSMRYSLIFNGIAEILDRYSPDALSVETQYVNRNVQSAMKLGMARGMAILAATQRAVPVFEYTPSRAKSAVVGNGRASKEQVQGMVATLLNLSAPPEPEDAADALALAICHAQSLNRQWQAGTRV